MASLATPLDVLRDALTRIAAAREEFDAVVRDQILEDLEHDLAGWVAQQEERST